MKDRALSLFGYAALLNFLLFWVISFAVGDALQGKITDGHYYLGNHGTYTEVSHAIFVFSACHAYSALGGVLLGMIIGVAWKRGRNPN